MLAIYDFITNHPYITAGSLIGISVVIIWLAPPPEFLVTFALGTHYFKLILQFIYIKKNIAVILASTLTLAEKADLYRIKLLQLEWLLYQVQKLPIRPMTRVIIEQFITDITEYIQFIMTLF